MNIFELENVQQRYNSRIVLDIDQLTVQQGETLAIIGPSGAGKSTLLRLMNFLEPPAAGQVLFDRIPASINLPLSVRRRVITVFQRPILLNRSVTANLSYALELRGEKATKTIINTWLDRLGLSHLAHHPSATLSAGEAQRVALARALMVRPDVLLLDEPTANLDPYNVSIIEDIVREENARFGTTIVLVTHNIFQARRLAHRTGLLLGGKLIEISETDTFFDHPLKAETRAFLRGEFVY